MDALKVEGKLSESYLFLHVLIGSTSHFSIVRIGLIKRGINMTDFQWPSLH